MQQASLKDCRNPQDLMDTLRSMAASPQYAAELPKIDYWILHYDNIERVYLGGLKSRFQRNRLAYAQANAKYILDESASYQWMVDQLA